MAGLVVPQVGGVSHVGGALWAGVLQLRFDTSQSGHEIQIDGVPRLHTTPGRALQRPLVGHFAGGREDEATSPRTHPTRLRDTQGSWDFGGLRLRPSVGR